MYSFPIAARIEYTAKELRARDIECRARRSRRGVPHIVGRTNDRTWSLTYFGSTRTWVIFHPYPGDYQEKIKLHKVTNISRIAKALRNL